MTSSDSLGWDPEAFHEFSEAVQSAVQEMGVWLMGSKLLLGFTTHSETG
jgi:hypothetical protein